MRGTVQQNNVRNVYAHYFGLRPMLSCLPSPAIAILSPVALSFSFNPSWYF